MAIHVVGGVYEEYCVHPRWNEVFGSGGRAAIALATWGASVTLHSYVSETTLDELRVKAAWLPNLTLRPTLTEGSIRFSYLTDLSVPEIHRVPRLQHPPLQIDEECVVRFGMLEGDAVVRSDSVVYDPQNVRDLQPFHLNGSRTKRLALVLNAYEAVMLCGSARGTPAATLARNLATKFGAEVVVIKMGPEGALVRTSVTSDQIPAFRTSDVWKVGPGDIFVAHFANAWMMDGLHPADAAERASRATAYYCETKGFPVPRMLDGREFEPIKLSTSYIDGHRRQVYLAGPFFDLGQIWMVQQTVQLLRDMGLRVFSPYHDVGLGGADDVVNLDLEGIRQSDLVLALTDGLDPGTIFEIGYARALGKPVVVYSERHHGENLKMMEGSGCHVRSGYTSALYTTLWEALKL